MCYAYQQLNDIGMLAQIQQRGPKRVHIYRRRKDHLPEYYRGEDALGPVLARARTKFSKERSTNVSIHGGEIFSRTFLTLLTSRTCPQSMHEILGDFRGITGLFDLAIGNMTDLSRDILKYVKPQTLELDSFSRFPGHHKS